MNFTDNPQTLSKLLANRFLFCFSPEVLTGSKWTVSIWVFICFYFPHTPPVEMLMNNDRGKKHRWQEDKEKKQKPGWLEHQPASSQEGLNIGGLQEHLLLTMRKGKGGGGGAWSPSCLGIWLHVSQNTFPTLDRCIYKTTQSQVSEMLQTRPSLNGSETGFPLKFALA